MHFPHHRFVIGLLCGALLLTGTGCGRIKHRLVETIRTLTDRLFRHYDADQPDTRFNRQRFEEHLQLPCPPDVQQLYCYADELGADATYRFAFRCKPATARLIRQRNSLRPDSAQRSGAPLLGAFEPFWWPSDLHQRLRAYSRHKPLQWHRFFWYDSLEQRAYYLEFTQ